MADDLTTALAAAVPSDDSSASGTKYLYSWLTGNMHRTYPLRDDCTAVSTAASGSFTLPQSLLIDMSITHRPMNATGTFFISRVDVNGNGIRLTLAFQPESASGTASGSAIDCARTPYISGSLGVDTLDYSLQSNSHTFGLYNLALSDSVLEDYPGLADLSASVVIGTCADMTSYGAFMFTSSTAAIDKTRVMSTVSGISYIRVINTDGSLDETLDGSFVFKAGDGISFTHTQATDSSGNVTHTVTVNRVLTEAESASTAITTVKEAVEAIVREFGQPIMRINGIAPSSYTAPGSTVTYSNNIQISGLDCTEVTSSVGGVGISNTCAKPCCSGTSTSDIQSALTALNEAKERLNSYYDSLSNNIYAMQSRLSSLIASRT